MPGAETREDVLAASLSTWGMALTEVKEYTAALAKGDDLVAEGCDKDRATARQQAEQILREKFVALLESAGSFGLSS